MCWRLGHIFLAVCLSPSPSPQRATESSLALSGVTIGQEATLDIYVLASLPSSPCLVKGEVGWGCCAKRVEASAIFSRPSAMRLQAVPHFIRHCTACSVPRRYGSLSPTYLLCNCYLVQLRGKAGSWVCLLSLMCEGFLYLSECESNVYC